MKTERISDSEDHITKEAIDHSTASLIKAGSVLIVTRSGILRHTLPVAVSSVGVTVNQDLKALTPRNGIMAEYVAWSLRAFGRDILNTCSKQGTTVNSVETAKLLRFEIPVAPPEQQRTIVAEIEKQVSRLDEAVANLKRAKANLKRYKAAVLKAAVEGKLTEEWRKAHPNVEPASKLLERVLAERREKWTGKRTYKEPLEPEATNHTLPKRWVWATVDQLSVVVRGASPRPAGDPRYFGGTIPWITVGPITADQQPYLTSVPETVTEAGRERSRYIEPHTLLLTNSGATLGVPKITLIGGCINDGVAALLDVGHPLKLYLLYFLHTRTTYLRGVNQGAAQPNLNTSIIKAINVPLPPHDEQEQVVAEVERRLSVIKDDGTPTPLERKGDGVQSLAALSLMRQSFESGESGRQLILAIEEPESHLHPKAIHQLKGVIADIAKQHQVIMTTHCPLFVDRTSIKSNILVHGNKALPAKDVRQIRDILGIRSSDNLQNAELILVVEGENDRRALAALLRGYSTTLNSAFTQGAIAIESLFGGSNLSYKLGQIRETMCVAHCYLDNDKSGLEAEQRAEKDGLMTLADANFCICNGMKESEIEDLYKESLYSSMIQIKYGVSTLSPKFKGTEKWSNRLRDTFKQQGKPWSEQIEAKVKSDIADLVELNPTAALNQHKRSSFDALAVALEAKLASISASKL